MNFPQTRRVELLDVAQALFAVQGYSNTSVQGVIDTVGISKGAFYHHFASKSELLDAVVKRMFSGSINMVEEAMAVPNQTAKQRLVSFFHTLDEWKMSQAADVIALGRALLDDANALVLVRHQRAIALAYVPILTRILEQGRVAGEFDIRSARNSAGMVWQVVVSVGMAFQAMWSGRQAPPPIDQLREVEREHACAIERMLGTEEGWLSFVCEGAIQRWYAISTD